MTALSPHADPLPCLTAPAGFRVASGTCGLKPSSRPDLFLLAAENPVSAAALFTRNRFVGAPVTVSRAHITIPRARAIVCNSGIANVATGQQGITDARKMCRTIGLALGCRQDDVLVCSTGIIGPRLPMEKIEPGLRATTEALAHGPEAEWGAGEAILTTDHHVKAARTTCRIQDATVTVGGMAKGSGMIAPNMATMLAFLTTDARISPSLLRRMLKRAGTQTFNRMSVDGDTSTSDSVFILASGEADHPPLREPDHPGYGALQQAITQICRRLAEQIIRDGEGVTRRMRVSVRGATSVQAADRVGRTVVNSPLVKTALHGGDPNWGRLVMAVGRSGAPFRPEELSIEIAGIPLLAGGEPVAMEAPTRKRLEQAMQAEEVAITIDLRRGPHEVTWLGADLSREYIRINADYTT